MVNLLLNKFGLISRSQVKQELQFSRSIGKRLDEHRQFVENIEVHTDVFLINHWHIKHMAEMDDYLATLYHLVYGIWPNKNQKTTGSTRQFVRQRPKILNAYCSLEQ